MRIKEINVSRLFGLFNHDVPMKMADRVTIITGPNGYGKTTILRLVANLVAGRYSEVRRVPFRDFRITFEDDTTLQVVRVDPASRVQSPGADLIITLLRGKKREEQTTLSAPPKEAMALPLSMIERALPGVVRQKLGALEARHEHLFDAYVDRMFSRKGKANQAFSRDETESWLSWLAQQMSQHSQSIFLIEQLQPSWLSTIQQRWAYVILSRLIGGMCLGAFLLVFMILSHLLGLDREDPLITKDVVEVLFGGGVLGLIVGAVDGLRLNLRQLTRESPSGRYRAITIVLYVLALLVAGLIFGLLCGLSEQSPTRFDDDVGGGIVFGLTVGLIFGVRATKRTLTREIQTVETISWSWKRAFKKGAWSLSGFIGIVIIYSVYVIIYSVYVGHLYHWNLGQIRLQFEFVLSAIMAPLEVFGFLYFAMITVPISLFGGITGGIKAAKTIPNQGIMLSARRAAGVFILVGTGCGLFGLAAGRFFDNLVSRSNAFQGAISGEPLVWLFITFVVGSIAGLVFGGLDVIQHYTLRLVMRFKGCVPSRLGIFLDHAVSLIFMQRVGGGFIFIHRLLLEHFAHLPSKWSSSASSSCNSALSCST